MIIENDQDITFLIADENTVSDFFIVFKEKYSNFKRANVILDFSDLKGIKTESISLFLQFSENHRNNGTSFVVVVEGIDFDSLSDKIIAVPTLQEAKDIIEMEKIERDLGF
jgi:hypothetical protein